MIKILKFEFFTRVKKIMSGLGAAIFFMLLTKICSSIFYTKNKSEIKGLFWLFLVINGSTLLSMYNVLAFEKYMENLPNSIIYFTKVLIC